MVSVSRRCGTRSSVLTPSDKSAAVMTGSTAFLAPLMATRPSSRTGPWITKLSNVSLHHPRARARDRRPLSARARRRSPLARDGRPSFHAERDPIEPGVVLQHHDVLQVRVAKKRFDRTTLARPDLH